MYAPYLFKLASGSPLFQKLAQKDPFSKSFSTNNLQKTGSFIHKICRQWSIKIAKKPICLYLHIF